MIYKKIEHHNYNVIGVKTDKYKSCLVEVIFHKNISENDLVERALLTDTMCFSTKSFPLKKNLVIKCQDLYNASVSASVNKLGNELETSFSCSFICPKYVPEKEYLEEIIKLLFEVLFNPNVVNDAFDSRSFNIIKKQILSDIDNIKEDPNKVSISNALKMAFKNNPTSYGLIDKKEYLEDLTSDKLYQIYQDMLSKDLCDIFAIGDLDIKQVDDLISKYYKNNIIKTSSVNPYLNNIPKNRVGKYEDSGNFVQSNLIMIYNLNNNAKKDLQITPYVFNNIFGNGSLNSKLFRYLREENSLCYGVSCMYLRFDKILIIKVSLAYHNIKKAILLIQNALKEMIKGTFTEDELEEAKKSAVFSVKIAEDYIGGLLNNIIFNYYDELPLPAERIQIIKALNKDDIKRFAKSLKLDTIYVLKEGQNETN